MGLTACSRRAIHFLIVKLHYVLAKGTSPGTLANAEDIPFSANFHKNHVIVIFICPYNFSLRNWQVY